MSSKNNQELLNNFYSTLINTLKKSNISIIKFFEENSDYITTNSFHSGCKKLGFNKKEEINTIMNKFLKVDLKQNVIHTFKIIKKHKKKRK